MGNESVTLAGITVPQQEIAIVNLAAWNGDGFTDGLVGLAYPGITSSFSGMVHLTQPISPIPNPHKTRKIRKIKRIYRINQCTGDNPTADNLTDPITYTPIFTSMYQQQLIAPLFSIAISRGSAEGPSGYLALGGLPPVEFTEVYGSSPIQILSVEGVADLPQFLTYYAITPDGVVYGNESQMYVFPSFVFLFQQDSIGLCFDGLEFCGRGVLMLTLGG